MTINAIPIMGAGYAASREEIYNIPLPKKTDTYTPLANKWVHGNILTQFLDNGWELDAEGFKTTRNDQRVLCKMMFTNTLQQTALVAWANSYDKSLSFIFGSGEGITCCTNGMFGGGDIVYFRKHTGIIESLIENIITKSIDTLPARIEEKQQVKLDLKNCEMSFTQGSRYLGQMAGEGILPSRTFQTALQEWKNSTFEEFTGRDAWCLYNACTYALQRRDPSAFHKGHIQVHDFMTKVLEEV